MVRQVLNRHVVQSGKIDATQKTVVKMLTIRLLCWQAGELMPIISMEMVPELIDLLPDGAPVVHLLQCPYSPPADEGQHLKSQPSSSGQAQERIEVILACQVQTTKHCRLLSTDVGHAT